jgi:phage shock protein PspC (stress-responsive transcriptional regulator)
MRDVGRLRRPTDDRMIAGVCSGLARHFDIDPVIVRVAMVVLAFFGGAGLLLYVAGWVLVPEEGTTQAPLGLDDRNRGIALIGVLVLAGAMMLGDWSGAFWFPWPLLLVGLAIYLVVNRSHRGSARYVPPAEGRPGSVQYAGPPASYGAPPASYGGQPAPYVPPAPPARRTRKRGPILFPFALALIALGIGLLGVVDLAGVAIVDAAYPALALGITGVMLLVGAFWGRAGGLIALGLLAAVVTAATTAAGHWDSERVVVAPTTAAAVAEDYDFEAGRFTLDLTAVDDLDALDGRDISVSGNVGELEVVVPDGVSVDVVADVHGPGAVELFNDPSSWSDDGFDGSRGDRGGIDLTERRFHDGGTGAPTIDLDLDLDLGAIVVREQ